MILAALFLGVLPNLEARELSFTCLAWDESAMEKRLIYSTRGKAVEIDDLHPLKRGQTYKWKGEGPILFTGNGVAPSPDTPEVALIKAKIPPGLKRALIVFFPSESSETGLTAKVYDDSLTDFPWGSYRVVNATGVALVCRLGEAKKPYSIAAEGRPVDIKPGGEKRNIPVGFHVRDNPKGWIYTSVWQHRPDFRRLIFVTRNEDDRRGVLELKVVPERKLPEIPAAPATRPADSGRP